MQVCKCALRIIRANLIFLLVYIVGLSLMGIFMAQNFDFEDMSEVLEQKNVKFALIDRDHSELSEALGEFLEEEAVPVHVDDSRIAFQDAVAKGQADYLLIIPEGYESAFLEASLAGEAIPQMEAVYSYYAANGQLVDERVDGFLGLVRTLIVAEPTISIKDALASASEAANNRADVQIIHSTSGISEADRFVFYLQWSTYTLFAGIVVCVSMLITRMNRTDVRRRNLASPMSYASYNVQLALSCGAIALFGCAWAYGIGVIVFSEATAAMSFASLASCALAMLAYSIMALAFGFMLGQLGATDIVCNATGNIVGMVISFLGGAWISLDLLSPEMLALAHWLPGFWYTDACQQAAHGGSPDVIMISMGVLLLFALAFLGIGLVAAKKRMQTAEAR